MKSRNLYIELFNETCILISAILVLELMNPALSSEKRDFLGWALIIAVCINVGVNLVIVSMTVYNDISMAVTETYQVYTNWLNRHKVETFEHFTDETRE